MAIERLLCAAAAVSLAVAAPLYAQDSSAAPPKMEGGTVVFDSTTLRRLPIDGVLELPVLMPGVYGLTDPRAFSVRGGLTRDAAIYVDGARIRRGQGRSMALLPSLLGTQQVRITTGLADVMRPGGMLGVLDIVTPTGGSRWSASGRYRGDDVVGSLWRNIGLHRLEAAGGGPLPLGITASVAVTLEGQRSLETEKLRDVQAPVYVASGIDTIIRQPEQAGDPVSDTIDLAIPRFMQYSGYCDESANGAGCQGLRLPFAGRGSHLLQAKLQRVYGTGGQVSLTVLAGRRQERDFPITALYNPTNRLASRASGQAFIANWAHALPKLGGRPLRLNLNLSYQSDEQVSGPLTLQSEAESRDPAGGFLLSSLNFVTDMSSVHDVTIAGTTHSGVGYLDDAQITCLLAGPAACDDLVPFLDRNDLLSAQPYRMNPYAAEQSARLPLFTSGLDGVIDLSRERRWLGRATLAWQVADAHEVMAGLDFARLDTRRYTAGPVSAFALDAYAERPIQTGAYIRDRVRFGTLQLEGALRIDRFDSRALYPIVPGRISSITDSIAVSGTDTFRLAPFDPSNPTANFRRASGHSAVSPQLQMFFDAWPGAVVRLAVGRQVQAPDVQNLFTRKNTDLAFTNREQAFGRDLEPSSADVIELGAHVDLARDAATSGDIALYSQDVSGEAVRLVQLPDPGGNGFLGNWRVFSTIGRGKVRGVDVMVRRRFSDRFTAAISASHQGGPALDGSRTFVAASGAVTFGEQAPLGRLLSNTSVYSIIRVSTNRRYTLLQNFGDGLTIDDGDFGLVGERASLPAFRTIDVRVMRSFTLGGLAGAAFVESKNLLNWTNLTDVFTETGEVTNARHRARFVGEQVAQLESEAANSGLARTMPGTGEPAVDFQAPGVCAGWTSRSGSFAGGPADCVLLQRAERRFGNGDGLFRRSEYTASFNAWYDLANAAYRFYGPGRRIRVGFELAF